MKLLKASKIIVLFVLSFLLFAGIEVSAITINSTESLKQSFEGKAVTIRGNEVTLEDNVTFGDEVIDFDGGDYEIELNGYTLTASELYISSGKVTIGYWGRVESYFEIKNNGTVVIQGGDFDSIRNHGKLTVTNAFIYGILYNGPEGNLKVDGGNISAINQEGTAVINGGRFSCSEGSTLNIYLDSSKTTINGGLFDNTSNEQNTGAITLMSADTISEDTINKIIGKGCKLEYDKFEMALGKYDIYYGCYNETVRVYTEPENYEEKLKRLIPDGKTLTLKTVKPNSIEEVELCTGLLTQMFDDENYLVYLDCLESNKVTEGTLCIYDVNGREGAFSASYPVKVIYDEPEENRAVKSFMNKMKDFNYEVADTYYQVTDMGLINYYITSNKSELWNLGAAGRALKYASNMIELTNGGNISFDMLTRAGRQDDDLMYESAFGDMSVFYNGYCYGYKTQGLHLRRVIYIPQDTANTKEAYVAAAKKRIDQYLGKNDVTVEYGGTLDSLPKDYEDELVDRNITDGNYYNVTIKGKTYKFYIVKGSKQDLAMPTYIGTNIETNIKVTTDKSEVPLDTELRVDSVENKKMEEVLGTKNYKAYDIKLYSDGKDAAITRLANGKFKVSIPVPKNLKGKEITVYYINSKGEKQEHIAKVKDNVASFETDHFSTYVLAEKPNGVLDNTPQTGTNYVVEGFGIVAVLSLAGIGILKNKKSYEK